MLLRRASCLLGPVQRAANAGGAALPKLILVHAPPTSVIAGRAHFSAVPPPADPQQPQPAAAGGNHKAFSGVCAAEEGGASSVHEGRRPLSKSSPAHFPRSPSVHPLPPRSPSPGRRSRSSSPPVPASSSTTTWPARRRRRKVSADTDRQTDTALPPPPPPRGVSHNPLVPPLFLPPRPPQPPTRWRRTASPCWAARGPSSTARAAR
jgi:hypothetical protein